MSRRADIERKTGVSKKQLYRWRDFGLLLPPQQHGAGRGSWEEWPNDTEERVLIIKEFVRQNRNLLDAGYELFLREYLLMPKLTRMVLLKHLDDESKADHARLHTPFVYDAEPQTPEEEPTEADEARDRRRIDRSLKPKIAMLPKHTQKTAKQISYTMNGLGQITAEDESLDYPSNAVLRKSLQNIDDYSLGQADVDTLAYLRSSEGSRELEKWEHDLGISAEQAFTYRLSLHKCKYPHTHAQAWRPLVTMLAICPQWDYAIAEKDQQLARPLVVNLVHELRNKGLW